LTAVEIKRTSVPKLTKGFFTACDVLQPNRKYVIYNGEETYSLAQGIQAISLSGMMQILQQYAE
jgi:hypothetical protein